MLSDKSVFLLLYLWSLKRMNNFKNHNKYVDILSALFRAVL